MGPSFLQYYRWEAYQLMTYQSQMVGKWFIYNMLSQTTLIMLIGTDMIIDCL